LPTIHELSLLPDDGAAASDIRICVDTINRPFVGRS